MKPDKKPKPLSPFMGWPDFIARQPGSVKQLVPALMESQWWPEETFRAGWAFQLKLLVNWAVDTVPYYKNSGALRSFLNETRKSDSDFWAAWRQLPLLTKTELRRQGDQLRYDRLPKHHLPAEKLYTSGSTGIPVEILNTAVTGRNWSALTVRDHQVWARDFGKRSGSIVYLPKEAQGEQGITQPDWGPSVRGLYESTASAAIHVSLPTEIHVAWLERINPSYLLTYPSVAEQLLDAMGATGKPAALEEIRFMSEPLDAALEQRLHDAWGVRTTDLYSANETGHIAVRCPELGHLHVQAETLCLELLDDAGEPCEPGETGRVIVTPLHNLGTPLIRYELGDYATAGEPCACGRHSPVLHQVLGRVRNYARTPDGRKFWPGRLGRIREIGPILQAQFVQIRPDTVELRMVVSRPLSEPEQASTIELVQGALDYPFNVALKTVDRIERGPTGKYEEFLSLLDNE